LENIDIIIITVSLVSH